MIVQEFLASGINAVRFVRQSPASDHFVLELDVYQLVFQIRRIGAVNHL